MKMNLRKVVPEFSHALFASLKTDKKGFWELALSLVSPPVAKVWPGLVSVWVCVFESYTNTHVCLLRDCSNDRMSWNASSPPVSVTALAPDHSLPPCDLKQGFREHIHSCSPVEVTCLDVSRSLLAKGKVTHRQREERRHMACCEYWNNK